MLLIKAKRIFDGYHFIENSMIVVKDTTIMDILPDLARRDIKKDYDVLDYKDATIVPGFIDLQINGAGGALFNNDISEDALKTIHKTALKTGCTSFLPTLITTTDEKISKVLDFMNNIRKNDFGVLGLHLEGPMISTEHNGTHNPKYIRVLSKEMIDKICHSFVKVVSLSPEVAPLEYIKKLSENGIQVSCAHSNATYQQFMDGVDAGMSMVTHLYNGMSRFNYHELNVTGAALVNDTTFSGIIVDGFHNDFMAVKLASKILKNRLFLITDAISAMGTDITDIELEGQTVHIRKDGYCEGSYGGLAGSTLSMDKGVRNLIQKVGLSEKLALQMASLIPATAIQVDDCLGKIQKNYIADLTVLDNDYQVVDTLYHGKSMKN